MSKVKIKGNASGTGVLTIEAPNTNTDRTITLPDGTGTLLNSDGDGSSLTGTGKVLQVVSTTKTDTFTTLANDVEVAITGLTATITPTATSSKVMVDIHIAHSSNGVTHKLRVKRGTTLIGAGDAAGSRHRAGMPFPLHSDSNQAYASSFSYLDSPSTTSATTYNTYTIADNGAELLYVNHSKNDYNTATGGRYISTITLTEIGA